MSYRELELATPHQDVQDMDMVYGTTVEPEAEPEVEPEAEPEAEPEVESKPEPEVESKAEPEAEPDVESSITIVKIPKDKMMYQEIESKPVQHTYYELIEQTNEEQHKKLSHHTKQKSSMEEQHEVQEEVEQMYEEKQHAVYQMEDVELDEMTAPLYAAQHEVTN